MSNQKIVFASILAAILATGLLALNPSMIGNAQAQMYNDYGYDNNYYQDDDRYSYDKKESKSSHVDIQKIKCVNSNINVNGIDITQIPEGQNDLATAGTAEAANQQDGTNGNELADRINFERNLVNICANVNANDQTKVEPPEEEPLATLSVSKTIQCTPGDTNFPSTQACTRLNIEITPDEFNILVSGNNPNPGSFDGSSVPVIVTLGPGNYLVSETADSSVSTTITAIEGAFSVDIPPPTVVFSGNCDISGAGTIAAGESETCNIVNTFKPTFLD